MIRHLTLKQLIASGAVIPTISYARVSSERQLSGEGLGRQRRGTLDWIAKHPELIIRLELENQSAPRGRAITSAKMMPRWAQSWRW